VLLPVDCIPQGRKPAEVVGNFGAVLPLMWDRLFVFLHRVVLLSV